MEDKSIILPTRFGVYLVKELATSFAYSEICSLDCAILDEAHWKNLCGLTNQIEAATGEKQMQLRIERIRHFFEYLNTIEEKWVVQCKRYHVGNGWDEQVVKMHLLPALDVNLKKVAEDVKRRFERIATREKQ